MVKSYADLKEKTIAMSGFFETSAGYPTCYGVTSGNHDGQGISHGVLQYNFGQGSLQPLWTYLDTNYNQICRDALGTDYDEWVSVLADTTANQVAWGETITDYVADATGHQIKEPWKTHFMTLGTSQPSIDKQITYAESWRPNAEKWFNNLGLWSRRGFALCWDISVQLGRFYPMNQVWQDFLDINPTGKTRAEIEEEKLNIIVNRITYDNNVPVGTQPIVYNRKNMLVVGTGTYYGTPFDMSQYDLNYEPAFKGGILFG